MYENLNLVNAAANNGSEPLEAVLDLAAQSLEPTLLAHTIGEDARHVHDLLNDLVRRVQDEKLDPKSSIVDSELKSIAKKSGIKLSSVRHDFAQRTKNAQQTESIENPDLGGLIKKDAPFKDEENKAAEDLKNQPNKFEVFTEDFKLTGYKASRELTDGGLMLLGRTLRATSSAELYYGKLATGKSEFANHVASFFPLARTLSLTTFSPKFLFYAGGKDGCALKGFIIVLGESDLADQKGGDTFKQQYFRQVLTENQITQGIVEQDNKKNQAKGMALYGALHFVVSSTDGPSRLDQQTSSRLYCRHFKHTHASINFILHAKADKAASPKPIDLTKLQVAQRKWRCFFTLLKKCEPNNPDAIQAVAIPFLKELVFKKNRHTEQDMRTFDRLIESIEVSALLNQNNRVVENGILTATWEDYFNVKDAFLSSVPAAKGISIDLLDRFLDLLGWWHLPENIGQPKSKRDLYAALNVDESTGKRWIYQWVKTELLGDVTSSNSKTAIRFYAPIENAKDVINRMKEDEDLGIEKKYDTPTEKGVPSGNESPILSTPEAKARFTTKKNQDEPSVTQAKQNALNTRSDHARISSDFFDDEPSKTPQSDGLQDFKNARTALSGKPLPSFIAEEEGFSTLCIVCNQEDCTCIEMIDDDEDYLKDMNV